MAERALIVNFIGDDASLQAAFKRTAGGLNGIQAAGRKMSSFGSTLTRNVTLPIVGIGAVSAKAAMDFDAAMTRIHTQAGASVKQVNQLSKAVLDMAGQVGESPQQLADGMYHVVSSLNATLKPAQRNVQELKALKVAAEGAKVGNADLVDVTNALDAAIVSGIKGVQNYQQAMGALNAVVGAGDMSMQDLADALGTGILAPMKRFGLSLTDVGGALAVFGDNNIRGADAATKLTSAIRIMGAPSDRAVKALNEIHLGALNLANDMRQPNGLITALEDLKQHLDASGYSASKQARILTEAFGGRQSLGVQILLGQLDRLKAKTDEVGAGAKKFSKDWQDTQKTAAQQTAESWDKIQADLIRFGNAVLPPVLAVGKEFASVLDDISHKFSGLPKGMQETIVKVGGLVAVIGPALKVLGFFTSGVGKLANLGRMIGAAAGFGGGAKRLSSSVGTMTVGTLIAKTMVGGPGAGGAVAAAEGGVGVEAEAAAATRLARLTSGAAFASAAGISAYASMSHAQGGALNQLNAAAHGIDPTNVLHLVGLPSVSDLLPAVKKRMPLDSAQIGAIGEGFPTNLLGAVRRQALGLPMPSPKGPVSAGAIGGPVASVAQTTKDYAQLEQVLAKFEGHKGGVKDMAAALDDLAQKAGKIGDVRWHLADSLGAELLKTHSVSSRGVQDLLSQFAKLPPNIKADTATAMLSMTRSMETGGEVAKGTTEKLRQAISQKYDQMTSHVVTSMGKLADSIQAGSVKAAQQGGRNMAAFANEVTGAMNAGIVSTSKGAREIAVALNATLKAFGSKPIPMPGLSSVSLLPSLSGNSAAGAANRANAGIGALGQGVANAVGAARGGLMQIGKPGEAGHDSVPLNVGGTPIVVAPGESVAVLNRHQRPIVDAALAPIGGLHGLFKKVNKPNYMASGGIVSYSGLEGLWDQAGGPRGMAPLMAAIAEAESGGNPMAHNPSGASGLWQILGVPFPGNVYDPLTNARMAVAKWRSQGLGAWTTYTSGAYRAFLHGNVPPTAGGALAQIKAPGVTGKGTLSRIVQAALNKATAAANAFAGRAQPIFGGGGGPAPTGGGFSPSQLTSFDGVTVAKWIANELIYARQHGWNGAITSGYRPGFDPHTVNGFSEHSLDIYPGGAVDFGGMVDPAGAANRAAFMRAAAGYPSRERLILPIGFRDDGHMSGTGHARGGMIPFAGSFGGGGVVPGAMGSPSLAMVHGGEVVLPAMASGGIVKNPAAQALAGSLEKKLQAWLKLAHALGTIPSQATSQQIKFANLQNAVTIAQNNGDTQGQIRGLENEKVLLNKWLAADKTKLRAVNRALNKKGLSRKQRATLLQDKLALIQEIGSIEGQSGSIDTSVSQLVSGSSSGSTTATGADALTQAVQQLQQTIADQTQYMQQVGEIEKRQAIKALADVISGQIGGSYLSRSTGSAGVGTVARY